MSTAFETAIFLTRPTQKNAVIINRSSENIRAFARSRRDVTIAAWRDECEYTASARQKHEANITRGSICGCTSVGCTYVGCTPLESIKTLSFATITNVIGSAVN